MFVLSIFVLVHIVNDGQLLKGMEGQKPDDEGNHRSNRRNVVCMEQMENFWKHIKGHYTEQDPRGKTENLMYLLFVPECKQAAQERGDGCDENQQGYEQVRSLRRLNMRI